MRMDFMQLNSKLKLNKSKLLGIAALVLAISITNGAQAQRVNKVIQPSLVAQTPQYDRIRRPVNSRLNTIAQGPDSNSGSMAGRFKKYMGEDQMAEQERPRRKRFKKRFQGMSGQRKRQLRQQLQNMPPEQRRQFIRRMRENRGGGMNPQNGQNFMMDNPGMGAPQRARKHRARPRSRNRGASRMRGGRSWFNRKPIDFGPLNLTEKQKAHITSFRKVNSQKARAIHKRLRAQRSRMKAMLFSPTASKAQIMKQHAQLRSLQNQAEEIMISDFLSIRNVLTEEQLQKLPDVAPGRRRHARRTPPKVAPSIGVDTKGSGL